MLASAHSCPHNRAKSLCSCTRPPPVLRTSAQLPTLHSISTHLPPPHNTIIGPPSRLCTNTMLPSLLPCKPHIADHCALNPHTTPYTALHQHHISSHQHSVDLSAWRKRRGKSMACRAGHVKEVGRKLIEDSAYFCAPKPAPAPWATPAAFARAPCTRAPGPTARAKAPGCRRSKSSHESASILSRQAAPSRSSLWRSALLAEVGGAARRPNMACSVWHASDTLTSRP